MKTWLKIFFTIWIVYVFFLSDYGGNYMASSMLYGTMAIIDNGNFEIDNYIKEGCKRTGCDHSFYDGKIYSGYPPGNSILPIPLYLVVGPALDFVLPDGFGEYSKLRLKIIAFDALSTIFITAILSALLSVLIYNFLEHFNVSKKNRLWVTFIFAFGTLFFTYSTAYFSRVNAGFILFASFYLMFLMKTDKIKKNKKTLFLLGAFSASSITLDYSTVLIVGLLFLYLISFLRNKKILYSLIGSLVPVILLLSYHYAVFDNPFSSSYQYHKNINGQSAVAENELKIPDIAHLWGVSFSPEKGYFFFMPIMIISIIGLIIGFKEKKFVRELLLISSIFIIMFIFNASLSESWKGNCAFGPRYLLVAIPFMIVPLSFVINKIPKITKTFGIISIFINTLPAIHLRTSGCELPNSIFQEYIPLIFEIGLRNYTLYLIDLKIFKLGILNTNLIMITSLIIIGIILYFIWKK